MAKFKHGVQIYFSKFFVVQHDPMKRLWHAWYGFFTHQEAEVAFFAAHVLTANLYRRVAIYGSAIIGNYE